MFYKFRIVNLETGEEFPTLNIAARAANVSPYIMRKLINDRVEWSRPGIRQRKIPSKIIRDDAGDEYKSIAHLSRESGFVRERVRELLRLDPEGIFRRAWIDNKGFRIARHDGKWWWVNGSIPTDALGKFRKVLNLMGHRVTVNDARKLTGDLWQ